MAVTQNDEPETAALDSTGLDIREEGVTPGADALFHALSARIRRRILSHLLETPETTDDELVDVIAGWRSTESGVVGAAEGEQIAGRNVTVEHHDLPPSGPSPFVTIRDDDRFLGAVTVDDLESLLAPATSPPWRIDETATTHRPLYELPGITVHVEPTSEIERYWVMAFDGGDEPQQCALVARQHDDTYEGVWTCETQLVETVFAALDAD